MADPVSNVLRLPGVGAVNDTPVDQHVAVQLAYKVVAKGAKCAIIMFETEEGWGWDYSDGMSYPHVYGLITKGYELFRTDDAGVDDE